MQLGRSLVFVAVAAVLSIPAGAGTASAESVLTRVSAPFRSVGRAFASIGRFFFPDPLDETLDAALESYAKGDFYTTVVLARRLPVREHPELRDEGDLLAGMAYADAGLREPAVARLRAVLDADPATPYYGVALAALLDLETNRGNVRAAANAAEKYVADFWGQPRTKREADAKGILLETGSLSADTDPVYVIGETKPGKQVPRDDRPAERAMYLAGKALVDAKRYEKALPCLKAIAPESVYFPYARYLLGQAYYALEKPAEALRALTEVRVSKEKQRTDEFLADRAALVAAQILHEAGEDADALSRLEHVSDEGPFRLHAMLLSAEIRADQDNPALALVLLGDGSAQAGEPKLAARLAAFDAELHRKLGDPQTAVSRLEAGLKGLEGYVGKLDSLIAQDGSLEGLAKPLAQRQAERERLERWRRENLRLAVPELVDGRPAPGWLTERAASLMMRDDRVEHPVLYATQRLDPFTALPAPDRQPFTPPTDAAFPTLFRRSMSQDLIEAFGFENQVRAAIDGRDDTNLALLLLDGWLRLRDLDRDDPRWSRRAGEAVAALGLEQELGSPPDPRAARVDLMVKALRFTPAVPPDAARHAARAAEARELLDAWKGARASLVRQAVAVEKKSVGELRYTLAFELSQTLGAKKEIERQLLQGS